MPEFEHPPISRHEALAPFSRDHYTGLVHAQRLMKSSLADAIARRKAVAEILDAWDSEIGAHFADEERLLADGLRDDDRGRLLAEHSRLSELAARLRKARRQVDPDPSLLDECGRLLDQHIRWEERELFERVQCDLSDTALVALGALTTPIEASRARRVRSATTPTGGANS